MLLLGALKLCPRARVDKSKVAAITTLLLLPFPAVLTVAAIFHPLPFFVSSTWKKKKKNTPSFWGIKVSPCVSSPPLCSPKSRYIFSAVSKRGDFQGGGDLSLSPGKTITHCFCRPGNCWCCPSSAGTSTQSPPASISRKTWCIRSPRMRWALAA